MVFDLTFIGVLIVAFIALIIALLIGIIIFISLKNGKYEINKSLKRN